nr:serine/threonine protein kinase [Ardenticatenales bacterium]
MRVPEELIGRRLGQYEVQALIASGGMAELYRGFDVNLERQVALKVLSEEATAQPDVAERFRREARLLASLRHPHIVQIYDFGEQDGYFYIVQELLPGPTLAQRLSEMTTGAGLPREEILAIAGQLASALDAAHAASIIHRDVKPSNILWNSAGRLVLTDFGIAKNSSADAVLTRTGQVLGTPAYVSPEQARGEPLAPASDLYAMGVVLYEVLAGKPPFSGSNPMEVVLQHLEKAPPPLPVTVPAAVTAVVARALAKEPSARFGSAAALAQALEE